MVSHTPNIVSPGVIKPAKLDCITKAWFPPMRLTYSHVYSYENKCNLNNLNKTLKKNLQLSMRLSAYCHKNNTKTFSYYSHNILIRLLRSKKDRRNICYF